MRKWIGFGLFALTSAAAHAGDYGTAGCGLGSLIFNDKPGILQTFAATTNGTLFNQTFAISSGTSNCGQHNVRMSAVDFIEVNKTVLAKDIARGRGEALDSFARLLGCPSENLGPLLKHNYDRVFLNPQDSLATSQVIFDLLQSEPSAPNCSALNLG